MNAREEAQKIYNKLKPGLIMGPFEIRGGFKRRSQILEWLKYYGADGKRQYSTGGTYWYLFEKKRSMGAAIKNPGGKICEYCRLIHGTLTSARSPKERRRALARFKLHRRVMHKNPPSKARARIAKAAFRIAYVLYKKFKSTGVPHFIINRIPTDIRPYVVYTLDINGIKVV